MNYTSENIVHRSRTTSFLVSVLSTFFIPGFAQFVGGRIKSAAIIFLAFVAISFINLDKPIYFFIFISYCLLVTIAAIKGYFINTAKQGVKLKSYNKWYYYLLFVIVAMIINYNTSLFGKYAAFNVPSISNAPTLNLDDRFITKIITLTNDADTAMQFPRGSFAVFTKPTQKDDNPTPVKFIKRVMAFPGETIAIRNGVLYVNEKPINEPYVDSANKKQKLSNNFPSVKVPAGSVFVLGDNRDESADSRYFGVVPISNIFGKALYIYWSHNISRIGSGL